MLDSCLWNKELFPLPPTSLPFLFPINVTQNSGTQKRSLSWAQRAIHATGGVPRASKEGAGQAGALLWQLRQVGGLQAGSHSRLGVTEFWIPTNCSHCCPITPGYGRPELQVIVWQGDSWEEKLPVVWGGASKFPTQQKRGVQMCAATMDHLSRTLSREAVSCPVTYRPIKRNHQLQVEGPKALGKPSQSFTQLSMRSE